MRYALAACVALSTIALPASSQDGVGQVPGEKAVEFLPENFKVKMVGGFQEQFRFRIDRILDDKSMIVELGSMPRFVVIMPTKDLAEDQRIPLPGVWAIPRTQRINGRTFFVLERPAKK